MTPIKTFIVGSSAFFKGLPGFNPKDLDELNIMDEFPLKGNSLHGHFGEKDVFFFRDMSKDEFIADTLEGELLMRAGKFLVPEFAKDLGMTIEDLKKLEPCFTSMDKNHTYEKVIYDSYLKNGDFYLTDEQRLAAYEEYNKSRLAIKEA